jgi:hypothetical protein
LRYSALAGAVALLLGAGATHASIIYQAPGDSTNQIGFAGEQPGAYGVGNTITFAGSGPFDLSTVDLFGYAGGGSLPIEIALYAGADPNTGTLIGSEEVTPTGNGYTTEVFNFDHLVVPKTLTYIVSIVGNSGSYDDSFVDWQQFTGATGAPTIGASGNMWYGNPGNFVIDNSYAVATGSKTDTLGAEFAVPEPATWAMMLLGIGMIGGGFRMARRMSEVTLSAA